MCTRHRSSDEVVYPPPNRPSHSPVEPRRYCKECGLIREHGGKNIGYFINKLQDIAHALERKSKRLGIVPLAEVEKRRIRMNMKALEAFRDPYGSSYPHQKDMFITLILNQRKIPETIFEDILF